MSGGALVGLVALVAVIAGVAGFALGFIRGVASCEQMLKDSYRMLEQARRRAGIGPGAGEDFESLLFRRAPPPSEN